MEMRKCIRTRNGRHLRTRLQAYLLEIRRRRMDVKYHNFRRESY